MTSAATPARIEFDELDSSPLISPVGAQTLLALKGTKPSYWTQSTALILYALLLAAAFTYAARPAVPPEEEAIELVMLPPVAPPEEQPAPIEEPPPVAEQTPPEEKVEEPPPPIAEEPVAPKPLPKPKPKPKALSCRRAG